jgi:dipeptidyl aminopeptidase/acylaminoacyl peptidase
MRGVRGRWLAILAAGAMMVWTSACEIDASTEFARRDQLRDGAAAQQSRPIAIDDIITMRRLGRLAISPDGELVAYLVVQAVVARDAYLVTLFVTAARESTRHDLLAQVETPAVRTNESDAAENIGAFLTGGIVFGWEPDGRTLVYGQPDGDGTALFRYSSTTHAKTPVGRVAAVLTMLAAPSDRTLRYCMDRPAKTPAAGGQSTEDGQALADPAYRYDRATFHAYSKHPWQDGRPTRDEDRELRQQCVEQDTSTQQTRPLASDALAVARIPRPAFAGRRYHDAPVVGAQSSPDGKYVLYSAAIGRGENTEYERSWTYFVEAAAVTPADLSAHARDAAAPPRQTELFTRHGQREGDVSAFFWTPDSKALICFRTSLDHQRITRIDAGSWQEKPLVETDWGTYYAVASGISANSRYLYAAREKADTPKQLCRLDLMTGELLLIDDINRQFARIQIPPHLPIRQRNHFGDELTGYLFLPPGFHGQSRLPFVAIRGQHWNEFCDGGTGVEFPGLVMAMRGYAVLFFEPSARHYPASERGDVAFSNLRFQSPMESLGLLIDDLDQKGWIDRTRTGLAGLSAGADLVDYAAGFSKLFSVGAAASGEVYAPANYFLFDEDQLTQLLTQRYGLGFPDTSSMAAWQRVSTSLNASHSTMPLLFQSADAEAWFTLGHQIAWQHAGLPAEMYVYPDEGHLKIHPVNRWFVMTRNLQWFDFWLRDVEDEAPQFAEQFRRWRAMRHASATP